MQLSDQSVSALLERYPDNIYDWAPEYGEPGYDLPEGGLVVLGDYWCRCKQHPRAGQSQHSFSGRREIVAEDLHDIGEHHPRIWEQMKSQGYEFEWYDEWAIDHEAGKVYRTQGDSYMWRPSAIYDEGGELMTADTDLEVWLEWLLDEPGRRCLPTNIIDISQLEEVGFFRWPEPDSDDFENGWHPGQTDDPAKILAEIARTHPDHDAVFVLTENSQFYSKFAAYIRPQGD